VLCLPVNFLTQHLLSVHRRDGLLRLFPLSVLYQCVPLHAR
jgi:hypothetical protein